MSEIGTGSFLRTTAKIWCHLLAITLTLSGCGPTQREKEKFAEIEAEEIRNMQNEESERIIKEQQNLEQDRMTGHLGNWYWKYESPFVADNGIGELEIKGNGTWNLSYFMIGSWFGYWVGDANNLQFWKNDNKLYPIGEGKLLKNGTFELSLRGESYFPGSLTLKRNVK